MTDNLLEGGDNNLPAIDPNKDYLQELVGEGKKFKTPQELARGKYEADLYVDTLTKRMDDLRNDYLKMREENTSRAKLEELIDQLQNRQQQADTTTHSESSQNQPGFDPAQLESIFDNKFKEYETSKKYQENFRSVQDKLKERYGANYPNVLKEQIDQLGLTQDFVNDLAKKHPQVLFKTLGIDGPLTADPFQAPPRSSQRNDSFAPKSTKRTWTYYQNMKQTNPQQYYDPKTAVQMHNDAIALGTDFQDGDFNR